MRIDNDIKLDYDDVLIRPKRSSLTSRNYVSLERTLKFPHAKTEWNGVPIISANMDGVGTFQMAKSLSKFKMMTALHKFHKISDYKKIIPDYTFITIGITNQDEEKLKQIAKTQTPKFICIDVANGYTERFVAFVKKVRKDFPKSIIMAGNVVTGEMTEELILSGADIVKVGIGPGSVCITRKVAGVGYPQLSAVIECADAAHGLKGLVCADGGTRSSGDIAKAFGAGADFVMAGGLFAGHDESGFKIITKGGKKMMEHYGSSSVRAMEKNNGGKASYRASEGKEGYVEYRGPVKNTVEEILGGLRSTCTYVGASSIKELSKRTTFVQVNRQLNNIF